MSNYYDTTKILGSATPSSLQMLAKIMPDVPNTLINKLLTLVTEIISKKSIPPKAITIITQNENAEQLFGGLLVLVQTILRQKPELIKEVDLRNTLKTLKFNEDCSNQFINYFTENKQFLYGIRQLPPYYLKIEKFVWRVDITLSSSSLNKTIQTVIIMNLRFTNGETRSFEISIAKFHMLRLYVASLLREFQVLDKGNTVKS